MTTDVSLVDVALRGWKTSIDRADKLFGSFSEKELQEEIAPGRNRRIYLWGHLTAVNDALIPLLGFGGRLHPELDSVFVTKPDRSVPDSISAAQLKNYWDEINTRLSTEFAKLSPAEWTQKHASVSEEDFVREPHRNRFAILLGRTSHLAYHLGQANLAKE
jgi:DinB superfamily